MYLLEKAVKHSIIILTIWCAILRFYINAWKVVGRTYVFCPTVSQQQQFNSYFEQTQIQYIELCGEDYIGTVRRLGLITFRLAMIHNSWIMDTMESCGHHCICSDTDFQYRNENGQCWFNMLCMFSSNSHRHSS